MKNLFLLFLLLPVFLQGQITKGTGISYFDSIPNVAPSLPRGTEIAFSIALKKLYRWDRTSSTWIEMKTSTDSLARTVLASGLFNQYAVPFGGSTGKLDQSAAFQFVLGQLQANSFATLGSAGAGYVGLSPQSSVPATPSSGIRVYADASGRFGWIGTNGYTRVFDASGITANRTFKLQNKTYTLADSADVASLSASLPSTYFPLPGGTLTGTGGAGFVGFPAQSSAPTAPAGGFRIFANGASNFALMRSDGYVTTIDFSGATGNRFFTLPTNAGTFGILENTQTWSGVNTFNNTVFANGSSHYTDSNSPSHSTGTGSLVWKVSGTNQYVAAFVNDHGSFGDGILIRGRADKNTTGKLLMVENNDGTFVAEINGGGQTRTGVSFHAGTTTPSTLNNTTLTLSSSSSISHSSGNGLYFSPFGTTNAVVIRQNTGNLLVGTTTDIASAILNLSSTAKFAINAPIMTDAQAAAITGQTAGGWVYSSTQQRPFVHNGTAFQGVVLGPQSGFAAGQIPYGGTGGNLSSVATFAYNQSTNRFGIGTAPVTGHAVAIVTTTDAGMIRGTGTVQLGVTSSFQINTSGNARPGATEFIMNNQLVLVSYDSKLIFHAANEGTSPFVITGAGVGSAFGYFLGQVGTGPSNQSRMILAPSSSTEFNQSTTYPSGSNYYVFYSNLSGGGSVRATNTGQLPVRAPLILGARFQQLVHDQGVIISKGTGSGVGTPPTSVTEPSAALDIQGTSQGWLKPRLSSSSTLSFGIASVVVVNGGSGYGTGTGVVIDITGGGGSGAAISFTYSGGVITGGTVLLKGTGYTSAPTVTISGGTGSGAVITLTLSSIPNGLEFFNTTSNRTQVAINSSFYSTAYTQDIKRDTSYQITNTNLDISGQTTNFKNRYHTVRIATAVTAAATANNVITMPVPHADLLGVNFKVSVVDVSGDGDISQLSFGTDGVDGYLSNGDGTYSPTQNLYPGLGVYVSVAWDQNKSAYRWFLQ